MQRAWRARRSAIPPVRQLQCGDRVLTLDRPRIMGVLNVTPDSFSDGGRFAVRDAALRQAERLAAEGADIIDVGGESTRPGAAAVDAEQELERIVPVLEALRDSIDLPLSVDTSKPAVMRAAVAAGGGLINDVYALRQPGALAEAAALGVPVCLMHMQGEPRTMQDAPHYDNVVDEVDAFLQERAVACRAAGVAAGHILLDPGFGFGKLLAHNLALLRRLDHLGRHGLPVVAGLSRKRMIGEITGAAIDRRAVGSAAGALLAVQRGASIVRVHDVQATRDTLAMLLAVQPELLGDEFG